MNASYELDVLIAEKVMGWRRRPPESSNPRSQKNWYRPGLSHPVVLPAFSKDIAAAWLVVERMLAADDETFGRWMRSPELYERGEVPGVSLLLECTNAEAARAICLAALNALDDTP